jgi:hypothetical protein
MRRQLSVAYLKTLSDGYKPEPSVPVIQVVLIGAVVVVLTGLVVFAVLKKYKTHKKPAGLS